MADPVPTSAHKILTMEEVASIKRTTARAIYHKLSRGTMLPLPIAEHPYRWNADDLDRWARGEFREAEARLRSKARIRGYQRRTKAS